MIKKLSELIAKELEYVALKINDHKTSAELNELYIEIGKSIEDISNLYPSTSDDAVIIFREWSKGVLSNKAPSMDVLEKYASWTASDECWNLYLQKQKLIDRI